ncbi:MAG: DUF692 domain-containing protein [Sphingomonas sp.]|nr:DUF692 domain-containing protein [Sphingomonas sp.]
MGTAAAPYPAASASGRTFASGLPPVASGTGLPSSVGLGLRFEHGDAWSQSVPEVGFAEIHAENFMMAGGPALALLDSVAAAYPISLHGVALSLGGSDPLDGEHLARLAALVARIAPASFSEHLAWSSHNGIYFNDLLPVAYDNATLRRVVSHIDKTQEALSMPLLLENPSTYVTHVSDDWEEVEFLTEIARRSGCGLLLDVNNVQVSATNHRISPVDYINRFPLHLVGEIHIAGHEQQEDSLGMPVLIDSHGAPVAESVWRLLDQALAIAGPRPVLLERDNDVPSLSELAFELCRIREALNRAEICHVRV